MNSSPTRTSVAVRSSVVALGLLLAMVATRIGHFGGIDTPPDASLAVFFLLGLYVASPWWLSVAIGLAAGVDGVVIAGDVSGACVTAAYVFLIPTYGAMWFAGRWTRNRPSGVSPLARLFTTAAAASVATVVAFLISNGSFYAFSGLFPDLSLAGYAAGVARYLPPYFAYTALYVATGLATMAVIRSLARRGTHPGTTESTTRG